MKLSRRRAASLYQQSPDRRRPTKRLRAAQAAFAWALLQNSTATFAADGQFWPEIQVNYRLDPQATVMVFAGLNREAPAAPKLSSEMGVGLGYSFNPIFSVRAGYREVVSLAGDGRNSEERIELDQTFHFDLPLDLKIGLRTREEARRIGGDISFRVRERIQLEYATAIAGHAVIPYGSAEIFYDFRHDKISKTRMTLGAVYVVHEHMSVDLYGTHENTRVNGADNVNAIGLTIAFHY
jgi:hypothetical protein